MAPGFIDIHSDSDHTLLVDPRAVSAIHQGVTTEVVGNATGMRRVVVNGTITLRDGSLTGKVLRKRGWGTRRRSVGRYPARIFFSSRTNLDSSGCSSIALR